MSNRVSTLEIRRATRNAAPSWRAEERELRRDPCESPPVRLTLCLRPACLTSAARTAVPPSCWNPTPLTPIRFSLKDGVLNARPRKGTSARGRWLEEDARLEAALRESTKDGAENVMIVDLLRNDLGRVSQPGSVHVPALVSASPSAPLSSTGPRGGVAEYGIGGGIAHYSTPADEYEECLLKARVVTHRRPDSTCWKRCCSKRREGIIFSTGTSTGCASQARYFGYPCRRGEVMEALAR